MKEYVFDTNAFNRVIDDNIDVIKISEKAIIYASHIQLTELEATTNESRKTALVSCFHQITEKQLSTESMVFPIVFDSMKFGDGTYEELRAELDYEASKLNNRKSRNKLKNNPNDAQIGEVALKNEYTLVSDDPELLKVMINRGANVLTYDAFINAINA